MSPGFQYAKRVDAKQPEIVEAFRKLGWKVAHTHTAGFGFPDLVVSKNPAINLLVEIKSEKGRPSDMEARFAMTWPQKILIVRTVEDVMNINEAWKLLFN